MLHELERPVDVVRRSFDFVFDGATLSASSATNEVAESTALRSIGTATSR
jgi:hypothetical protein